jgi:hypothetical protein
MKPEDLITLVQPLCTTDPCRPWMQRPFIHQGHLYATDGRILACLPVDLPDSALLSTIPMDKIQTLVDRAPALIATQPPHTIPKLPPALYKPCFECKGDGHWRKCPECEGTGETECSECGQDHTCADCKGMGEIPGLNGERECGACDGTGKILHRTPVTIGHATFERTQLHRILTVFPDAVLHLNDAHDVSAFTFTLPDTTTRGIGCIMPILP